MLAWLLATLGPSVGCRWDQTRAGGRTKAKQSAPARFSAHPPSLTLLLLLILLLLLDPIGVTAGIS